MAGVNKNRVKTSAVTKRGRKRELEDGDKTESTSKEKKLNSDLSKSKQEYAQLVVQRFGIDLPDDFYLFYDLISNTDERQLDLLGLRLTGPYDLLSGKISKDTNLSKAELHLHGRHYYDTPEMMTVLYSENNNGFHISYFRDTPSQLPQLLVSNKSDDNGELTVSGDNIFAAVHIFCKELLKSTKDSTKLRQLKNVGFQLEESSKMYGYSLDTSSAAVKARNKIVVTKSFHKFGIVVPMDKSGVGYRELPSSDRDLKKMLTKIVEAKSETEKEKAFDDLQEIITLIQFANDECDYGMGLELGIDLFVFGHETFHGTISHLLPLAYQLLGRDLYGDIVEKHLEKREKCGPILMTTS